MQMREKRFAFSQTGSPQGLFVAGVITYLLLCMFLMIFLPPLPIIAHLIIVLGIWMLWRWPVGLIALILLLTPFQPLPTLALKAFGYDGLVALSSLKEIGMLGAVCVLAWRRRFKIQRIDILILGLLGWALLVSLAQPNPLTWIGLKDDFDFILPFYAGRLILLDEKWVKYGLWVAAFVACLGLIEFFFLGSGPRMLLLGITDPSDLVTSYRATYFSGLRATSTLNSPLEFGAFCGTALLLLASFYRGLSRKYVVPATLLTAGLIASLTRMAWLALIVGLLVIAFRTGQKLRFTLAVALGVCVFLLAIVPLLHFEDFISSTTNAYDPSLENHYSSVKAGVSFTLNNPLGVGAGLVGPRAAARNPSAMEVESSVILFGMAYGWLGFVLFLAFWSEMAICLRRNTSTWGIAASAVGLGMFCMLVVSALHIEFALNSWVLTLLGFGIQESALHPT